MANEAQKEKTYGVIIGDRKFFHKKDDLIVECRPEDLKRGDPFYITESDGSYCYLLEDTGEPEWHRAIGEIHINDDGIVFIEMEYGKITC